MVAMKTCRACQGRPSLECDLKGTAIVSTAADATCGMSSSDSRADRQWEYSFIIDILSLVLEEIVDQRGISVRTLAALDPTLAARTASGL